MITRDPPLRQICYNSIMSEYVTVTMSLPKRLYRRAAALAQEQARPVDALVAEALEEAIPEVYVSPDRARMEEEQAAYERLRESLLETHEGQHVAIHGGELVDADAELMALVQRVISRFPSEVVHSGPVTRGPDRKLRVRSPRLEKLSP